MKTNKTGNQNKTTEQLNRALWAACMGNIGMANRWLIQASEFIRGNSTARENHFVCSAHVSNRRKAVAAYRLAIAEGNVPGGEMPRIMETEAA